MRVLKCAIAPSSSELSWETAAGLLGIKVSQEKWKPTQRQAVTQHTSYNLRSFHSIQKYLAFVEEMYDEAGKLPPLSNLLVDALDLYPQKSRHSFTIVPQPRLLKHHEFKSDYMIAVVEVKSVSFNASCT